MPNDEPEQERMDLQYRALLLASRNKLFFAPIRSPRRVLDIGTGTGIWAIEFADQTPEAEIIGTDLSPIQPRYVPPNLKFEIDDAEDEWTFPENHFDYIHERLVICGSIKDIRKLFDQSFRLARQLGKVPFHLFSSLTQ
jgi:ubiquinone/menaquinone biosynthesis C-methylase UbiE